MHKRQKTFLHLAQKVSDPMRCPLPCFEYFSGLPPPPYCSFKSEPKPCSNLLDRDFLPDTREQEPSSGHSRCLKTYFTQINTGKRVLSDSGRVMRSKAAARRGGGGWRVPAVATVTVGPLHWCSSLRARHAGCWGKRTAKGVAVSRNSVLELRICSITWWWCALHISCGFHK